MPTASMRRAMGGICQEKPLIYCLRENLEMEEREEGEDGESDTDVGAKGDELVEGGRHGRGGEEGPRRTYGGDIWSASWRGGPNEGDEDAAAGPQGTLCKSAAAARDEVEPGGMKRRNEGRGSRPAGPGRRASGSRRGAAVAMAAQACCLVVGRGEGCGSQLGRPSPFSSLVASSMKPSWRVCSRVAVEPQEASSIHPRHRPSSSH